MPETRLKTAHVKCRRFQGRAVRLRPQLRKFLREQRVARLASINPDGTIHLVPVCFVLAGDTIFSTVIKGSKRVLNITQNPNVTVLADRYEERKGRWTVLRGVLMYGEASLLSYPAQQARFMKGWRLLIEKYPQYRHWAGHNLRPSDPERRRIMTFEPLKVVSWGFD